MILFFRIAYLLKYDFHPAGGGELRNTIYSYEEDMARAISSPVFYYFRRNLLYK